MRNESAYKAWCFYSNQNRLGNIHPRLISNLYFELFRCKKQLDIHRVIEKYTRANNEVKKIIYR